MAQVILLEQNGRGDWFPFVAIPSLDYRSETEGAIIYISKAVRVDTRKVVNVKALGTGRP